LDGADSQAAEAVFAEVYGKYHLGEVYDLSHFHDTVWNASTIE